MLFASKTETTQKKLKISSKLFMNARWLWFYIISDCVPATSVPVWCLCDACVMSVCLMKVSETACTYCVNVCECLCMPECLCVECLWLINSLLKYICVWVCDWKNFTECFGTCTMWNCLKCVKLCVLERIWIPGVSFRSTSFFKMSFLPIRLKPKVYQVLSAPIEYVCLYVCNCQLRNFGTPEPYCQIITIHSSSHSNLKVSTWIIVSKKSLVE